MTQSSGVESVGGWRSSGRRANGIWVGIGLLVLAVLAGEAAAYLGVPSPNRTNVLFVVIGVAALYRGGRAGLVVAVIAWLYQFLSIGLPGLPFAYSDEGRLRLFVTALAMPGVALALGAFHDTLERVRRSEAAERMTSETLAVIIGAAPAAVITMDVEGRVKLWNPAAEQMFGWTSAEVVGRPPPIVPPDRSADDSAARDGALAGDPARDLRTLRLTKDGRTLDVSLSIATIRDARGGRSGTVDTLVDITDQNRQEAQRVGAQRAELLGRLTAGVAHDFANILTAVSGYSTLVSEALPESHDAQPDVAAIHQAVERGVALTRQLLAYGRHEPQSIQPVNVGDVVEGVLPMLQQLLGPQCLLEHHLTPDLGRVRADPGQLEQIIANLVINARDAMPAGGHVTVTTANIERDEAFTRLHPGSVPGRYVSLTVEDTGNGIDPSIMESIFEPYFTTKKQGTGLGLATVYAIVKQSGGYVSVRTAQGQGAAFTVDLPRIDAAGSMARLAAQPTTPTIPRFMKPL
jgi:two-component system cell cycle sensor histidine kinase/response regulator CckA